MLALVMSIYTPIKKLLRGKLHEPPADQKKHRIKRKVWNGATPARHDQRYQYRNGPNEHAEPNKRDEKIYCNVRMGEQ